MHHRGAVASGSRSTVGVGMWSIRDRTAREVRRALEWAHVRALAGDGLSEREIARRLGITTGALL